MWPQIQHRVLPVATWVTPLGAHYAEAASLQSSRPFRSSQPLRVVVVADRSFAADGTLAALQARFPQAHSCRNAPLPGNAANAANAANTAVVLSLCDLEVP